MNTVLPSRYSESAHRLALGVEAIDAAREQPLLTPVMLTHDDAPLGNPRQPFLRHASNRQALLYDAYYAPQARTVTLRLFDQVESLYSPDADRRRFVPRRLQISLPTLAAAEAAAPAARGCRPHLFPAAAYPISQTVTGLRAHVMRAAAGAPPLPQQRPARWARVWATVPSGQPLLTQSAVVARAMCDERGEFLLIVRHDPAALGVGSLLSVRLRVFAAAEAQPPNVSLPGLDPLWDAPIETPASLADTDPVLRGEALPAGYAQVGERVVNLPLGRLLRGQPVLLI
ncbi:MAG: hypothetical protein Q7U73_16285 [Rubrivivax sp.]|nr:hypothetical protein [Rubrivivax sp.]